ncbi:hypothetical protein GCM10010302_06060 [Streptomyces polychromogenes]|uniref:Uncharacterized protein n=1 Tax=Streptomyces polychromogenes TaxID=67342 RepID=A0ABN0V204_9ACTN
MEFFGPWEIQLGELIDLWGTKLTLAGTDNADGEYFPVSGQPLDVAVTGSAWTISVQMARPDDDGGQAWDPRELRRSTRFDRMTGLVVDIESGLPQGDVVGPLYFYMHLVCVCRAPGVAPDPVPNPYDFTLPGRT